MNIELKEAKSFLTLLTTKDVENLIESFVKDLLKDSNLLHMSTLEVEVFNGLTHWLNCLTEQRNDMLKVYKKHFEHYETTLKKYYFPEKKCPVCQHILKKKEGFLGTYNNNNIENSSNVKPAFYYSSCVNEMCGYSNESIERLIELKEIPEGWTRIEK